MKSSFSLKLSVTTNWQNTVEWKLLKRIKLLTQEWTFLFYKKKIEELDQIIDEEKLDKEETYKYIKNAFSDGYVQTTGTSLAKILPPVSRFTQTGDRTKKIDTVIEKIKAFFNKFWDISGGTLD